tara:strand:+ start:975 stop:2942 length:1968 start_codon:yes stop_codon:yes gene_type:complete
MSDNFPNAVYIPTGLAGDDDFIRISGYCYRRVDTGVVSAGKQITNFVTGFDSCLDCNTCNCPKTIEFIMGGIRHDVSADSFSFAEKSFKIQTSSVGWQEIAIESGFLNDGDSNINFKPVSIRCYDRKIDLQSGIYASFDSDSSYIAHFNYASGQDIYERRDLSNALAQGEMGQVPAWDYITQHDNAISYQNTLKTIKFKSLCETPCSQYDVNFRLRGQVSESFPKYMEVGGSREASWVYLNCTGVPRTPGQIVRYEFGTGLSFQKYFLPDKSVDDINEPAIKFQPEDLELVNLDLLTGNSSDPYVQLYSVTGHGHYFAQNNAKFQGRKALHDYAFDYYPPYENSDFYSLDANADGSGSEEFSANVGIYGLNYNRTPHCADTNVQSFKSTYGVEGKSGCFQTSEFMDGIYRVGTYRPMMFTGNVTGNGTDFSELFDSSNPNGITEFSSGVYVFQIYPSGNDSQLSGISGWAGRIDDLPSEDLITEYRKQITNSLPINIDNPIRMWNYKSGHFVSQGASLLNGTAFLEFSSQEAYNMWYQTSSLHDNGIEQVRFVPFATGFRYGAGNYDLYYVSADGYVGGSPSPPLLDMDHHQPLTLDDTIVEYSRIKERHLFIDSGNALHNPSVIPGLADAQADDPGVVQAQQLLAITFQIPFDT